MGVLVLAIIPIIVFYLSARNILLKALWQEL